ncbi:hypothetical protein [Helicobacter japonicus]|nr:hypothetical protein [Helicobacter japonicus]
MTSYEILNTLKALNPDESKADFKAKDRLESILETRDMEVLGFKYLMF